MKRLFVLALTVLLWSCLVSASTLVSYHTNGSFTAGGSANGVACTVVVCGTTNGVYWGTTTNNLEVVYTNAATQNALVDGGPLGISTGNPLGAFSVKEKGTHSALLNVAPTGSSAFDLTVNQALPTIGNGSFLATLHGNVKWLLTSKGGSLEVDFANTTITIGAITYTLENLNDVPTGQKLLGIPSGSNAGWTTTDMSASILGPAPVPEPGTMLLFGSGAGALAGLLRRRR